MRFVLTPAHVLDERHSRLYPYDVPNRRKFIDFPSHELNIQVSSLRIYVGVYKLNVVEKKIAQITRVQRKNKYIFFDYTLQAIV